MRVNEATKILFGKAIDTLNRRLKNYARKNGADPEYVKNQDQLIQNLYNYFKEAEEVIQHLNFNRKIENVFYINNHGHENKNSVTTHELNYLRKQNEKLKIIMKHFGIDVNDVPYYDDEDIKEMKRQLSISEARKRFNF